MEYGLVAVGDGIELVDKLGMGRGGAVTQSVEPVFDGLCFTAHGFDFDYAHTVSLWQPSGAVQKNPEGGGAPARSPR